MEHLTTLDAAFTALDDEHSAVHVASLAVFAGPPLDERDFVTLFRRKLHLVPRLRQVQQPVPLGLARPAWVDAADFDLHDHLARVTLDSGGTADLERAMGEFVSIPLEPSRPLWQVLLVDGLADGGFALATKVHHSVLDGIGGLSMLGQIFDTDPDAPLPAPDKWHADRRPTRTALVRSAARAQAHSLRAAVGGVLRAGVRPGRAAHDVRSFAGEVAALQDALRPTVRTSLAGPLGGERAYLTGRISRTDIETIRAGLGGTSNDVVLAIVTAAHRRLVLDRRETPRPHEVHCLVPVSLRPAEGADPSGNRVSALIVDLPVEFGDPFARYEAVLARMLHAKQTHEAQFGADLQTALDALPPPLVSAAVYLAARLPQRFLTTVVTNVPGTTVRLYVRGRPLVAHYPYVPIADRLRTGFAFTSYQRQIYYGITADRDSVPDAAVLRTAMQQELAALTRLARTRGLR
jgi:diacylglycerol O-acyltransferase